MKDIVRVQGNKKKAKGMIQIAGPDKGVNLTEIIYFDKYTICKPDYFASREEIEDYALRLMETAKGFYETLVTIEPDTKETFTITLFEKVENKFIKREEEVINA